LLRSLPERLSSSLKIPAIRKRARRICDRRQATPDEADDNAHEQRKRQPSAFRRPSCSASERASGTEEFRRTRRSNTHGAGLAGDVWARKKRMRIANRYEFPSDRRQTSSPRTARAAVGGFLMRRASSVAAAESQAALVDSGATECSHVETA
jgi:hypothetical protein